MVTLVQDFLLRLYLVLAEIATNWQKELRREWQYGACILQLPQSPVFWHCYWNTLNYLWELSWIKQLVWQKKHLWSLFVYKVTKKRMRKHSNHTNTNTSKNIINSTVKREQIPPTPNIVTIPCRRGHPGFSGSASLWMASSSAEMKVPSLSTKSTF